VIHVYVAPTHSKIDYRDASDAEIIACETILKDKFKARDDTLARHPMVRRGLMSMEQSFYNAELNLLPTGLIPYLRLYLKNNNLPFEIKDLRQFPWFDKEYLNQKEIVLGSSTLRGYQTEVLHTLSATRGGIIQAPTGVGKGTMFAAIIRLYSKSRILCLFNRIDLVNQTRDELINKLGFSEDEIGIIQGSNFQDDKQIILLSIQSYEKAQHIFPKITVIVADEVHETGRNPTSEKIIYSCQNASVKIGLTATTEIDNAYERMKMFSIIGPIVYKSTIKEKIDEDVLAKIHIKMYEIGADVHVPICGSWADLYEKRKITKKFTEEMAIAQGYTVIGSGRNQIARKFIDYGDESNLYIVNDERNELIAKIAKTKERCLILFDKIKHGHELQRLLPDAFLVHGSSDLKDRTKAKELLRDNPNQIVLASSIFATGVNIPAIRCYINAAAGKGNCKIIQKLGRTTRKDVTTNKTEAEVIDFYDRYNSISIKQSNKRLKIYTELLEFEVDVITT
jgi:superfamily II DNA or RNA helicase